MAFRYGGTLVGVALGVLLALATPTSLVADSSDRPFYVLTGSPPPGFEDLTGPQEALVDVYYGQRRIATVPATYTLDHITFHEPARIVAGLPPLADDVPVLDALNRPLSQAAVGICAPSTDQRADAAEPDCTAPPPEPVAVNFHADRFRAELFVNPDLFAVQSPTGRYLPPPETGFSTLHTFSVATAGSDRGDNLLTLEATSIAAYDANRLVVQGSYSDVNDVAIDRLFVQRDDGGFEYVAGLFGSSSGALSFAAAPTLGGVRMASTLKTRTDQGIGYGTPISVSLATRARVDILRDGRLVSSRFYDPGNQLLDTSLLPEGAYELVIRIHEAGRVREELVFFSKTSQIPPRDQPLYTLEIGAVLDRFGATAFPEHDGDWLARLAHSRRLTDSFGIAVGAAGTREEGLLEFGLFQIDEFPGPPGSFYQLQAGAFAGSDDSHGLHVHGQIRAGSLYASADLRQVEGANPVGDTFDPEEPNWYAPGQEPFSPIPRTLTQGSVTLQLPVLGGLATLGVRETRPELGPTSRSQTLSYRRPLLRGRSSYAELRTDINYQDERLQALVGVRLYLRGNELSGEVAPAFRYDDGDPSGHGYQMEGTTTWNRETPGAGSLRVAASAISNGHDDSLALSSELDSRRFRSGFAVSHQRVRGESETSWAGNLATSVVTNGATWGLGAQNQSDAAVLVTLDGASPDTEFEVLVDGYRRGFARGGATTVLHLPAYRNYELGIRPRRSAFVDYDDSVRTVTLYPGSVSQLSWAVDARMVVLGRVLDDDGQPLAHAALLTTPGGTGPMTGAETTDAGGYFQAEVKAQASVVPLRFLVDGEPCVVDARIRSWRGGVAFLEPVTCSRKRNSPGLQASRP